MFWTFFTVHWNHSTAVSLCVYPFYEFDSDVFLFKNDFLINIFFRWRIKMWCRGGAPCLYHKDVSRPMHVTKFY
jgi:hypothetical protein